MVPGSGTNPFRIPDPGVKKEPYPGSGSATLVDCFFFTTAVHSLTVDKVIFHIFSTCRRQRGAASPPTTTTHTVAATGAIFFFGGGGKWNHQGTECRYQCTTTKSSKSSSKYDYRCEFFIEQVREGGGRWNQGTSVHLM